MASSLSPSTSRPDGQVLKGLLDTLVLSVLATGENYGFGILQCLREQLGDGGDVIREATLYPLLHRLESRGYVDAHFGPGDRGTPRKYYRLTKDGRAHLDDRTAEWRQVVRILEKTVFDR